MARIEAVGFETSLLGSSPGQGGLPGIHMATGFNFSYIENAIKKNAYLSICIQMGKRFCSL